MTDTDKLKRLADEIAAYPDWMKDDILALIAENERLDGMVRQLTRSTYDARKQRDEAVALLRAAVLYCEFTSTESAVNDFLARIEETPDG